MRKLLFVAVVIIVAIKVNNFLTHAEEVVKNNVSVMEYHSIYTVNRD